jgi:hypothetical protein
LCAETGDEASRAIGMAGLMGEHLRQGIGTARWPHHLASRATYGGPRRCRDGAKPPSVPRLSRKTTYEGLKTSYQAWHGDMTDIDDQR